MGWLASERPKLADELTLAVEELDAWRSKMLAFMKDVDVILCPVHPTPAVRHGATTSREFGMGDYYSSAFNLTGWPAAAVRAGTSPEGLPIAVQVVGQPWREDVVLAVSQWIEKDLGGWKRPPL